MTEFPSIRNLRIFLASPGDLVEERKSAKKIVDRINKAIIPSGWHIELLAWEDTLPGVSRPQDIINQEVDICNLFVGLLWRRWGQKTGKFSSGFEEEFERVRKRNKKTGEPEIWLYLKKIDPDSLNDPGQQLQKVLSFRDSVQSSRELLYKEFADIQDWEEKFQDHLWKYFLPLFSDRIEEKVQSKDEHIFSPVLPQTPSLPDHESSVINRGDLHEEIEVLKADFEEILTQSDLGLVEGVQSTYDISKASRIFLLSSSIISERTSNIIGTHEINLIYRYRTDHNLLRKEFHQILRTIISDRYNHLPGWYWFSDNDEAELPNLLIETARGDANLKVRERAIDLLTPLDQLREAQGISQGYFLSDILLDESASVVKSAIKYIVQTRCEEGIQILDEFLQKNDWKYKSEGEDAKLEISALRDPNSALESIINSEAWVPSTLIDILEDNSSFINEEILHNVINHSSRNIRRYALRELIRRGTISLEEVESLKADSDLAIKWMVCDFLITKSVLIDEEKIQEIFSDDYSSRPFKVISHPDLGSVKIDDLIYKLYLSYDEETLEEKVDWYELNGHIAYWALANKFFDSQSTRIFQDLKTNFQGIREKSSSALHDKYGENVEQMINSYSGLHNFFRDRFTAYALSAISIHGTEKFLDLTRAHLDSDSIDVLMEAVRAIGKIGDSTDVNKLIEIAESKYGDLQVESAKMAITIHSSDPDPLLKMVSSKSNELVQLAIRTIVDRKEDYEFEELEPFLWSKNDLTRVASTYFAIIKLDDQELKELLQRYIDSDRYFYNVVCWIDRYLYSHPILKDFFINQIRNKLSNTSSQFEASI